MTKIIALSGFIGSGKGTVADFLVENHGFYKISFADKLKDIVAKTFDWDRDLLEGSDPVSRHWREEPDEFWSRELNRPITPRWAMQTIGTNCFKSVISSDIWILFVKQQIDKHPDKKWVITDVRFQDERQFVLDIGGEHWCVKHGPDPDWVNLAIMDNQEDTDQRMKSYDVHPSEWRWIVPDDEFDYIIHNNAGIRDLENTVDTILRLSN